MAFGFGNLWIIDFVIFISWVTSLSSAELSASFMHLEENTQASLRRYHRSTGVILQRSLDQQDSHDDSSHNKLLNVPTKKDNDTTLTLTSILDKILNQYDKRIRPGYVSPKKRDAVPVTVSMYVSSVSSISEVDMDFTLDMYFRQRWRDERLAFEQYIAGHEEELDESVSVAEEMLSKIWWPDTFFANARKAEFHHATTRNAFLRIDSKGNILHSLRLTVTAMCPMDLIYFPMDFQICSLEIESFGYTNKDIKYFWNARNAVDIDKDVRLPQYIVRGTRQGEKLIQLTTGNYSRLSVQFHFERSMGYYLIQIYIPSTLIVVLSWVSFWFSRAAVPARVALGITTVLTMTTLISSTNASLPKISYLKSIDVYLVTCFFMVFATLLEYAAVSYLDKKHQGFQQKTQIPPVATTTATSSPILPLSTPLTQHASPFPRFTVPDHFNRDQPPPPPFRNPDHVRQAGPTDFNEHPYILHRTSPLLAHSFNNMSDCPTHVPRRRWMTADQHRYQRVGMVGQWNGDVWRGSNGMELKFVGQSPDPSPIRDHRQYVYDDIANENTHHNFISTSMPHEELQDFQSEKEVYCRAPFCSEAHCLKYCRPSTIDKYARILFPLTFTVFNIFYWSIYLYISRPLHDGQWTTLKPQ